MDTNEELQNKITKQEKRIFGLRIIEFILILLNIFSVIFAFIFFDKNWLSFSCSLIGCFAILFLAKGYFFAPIVNVVYDILYIIVSYTQNYFGEAIIYLAVTLPIDIYASFSWPRKRFHDTDIVKIRKIGKKEWIYFSIISVAVTIAVFFVLRAIGTDEIWLSVIAFSTTGMAGYLLMRNNSAYTLIYAINSFICFVLWTMALVKGNISYLPITINFFFNFLLELYGFFNLRRERKVQEQIIEAEKTINKERG